MIKKDGLQTAAEEIGLMFVKDLEFVRFCSDFKVIYGGAGSSFVMYVKDATEGV